MINDVIGVNETTPNSVWEKRRYEWTLNEAIKYNIASSANMEDYNANFPQWQRIGFRDLHEKFNASFRKVSSSSVILGFLIFEHEYHDDIDIFSKQYDALTHSRNPFIVDITTDYTLDISETGRMGKQTIVVDHGLLEGMRETAMIVKMNTSSFLRLLCAYSFCVDTNPILHNDQIELAKKQVSDFSIRFENLKDLFDRLYKTEIQDITYPKNGDDS